MNKNNVDYDEYSVNEDIQNPGDIKINPDFYIHNALVKAQTVLAEKDGGMAFFQYRVFIEHIEVLASSARMLPDDYHEKIKELMEGQEYLSLKENDNQEAMTMLIANEKLRLIMEEVFDNKPVTSALTTKE